MKIRIYSKDSAPRFLKSRSKLMTYVVVNFYACVSIDKHLWN